MRARGDKTSALPGFREVARRRRTACLARSRINIPGQATRPPLPDKKSGRQATHSLMLERGGRHGCWPARFPEPEGRELQAPARAVKNKRAKARDDRLGPKTAGLFRDKTGPIENARPTPPIGAPAATRPHAHALSSSAVPAFAIYPAHSRRIWRRAAPDRRARQRSAPRISGARSGGPHAGAGGRRPHGRPGRLGHRRIFGRDAGAGPFGGPPSSHRAARSDRDATARRLVQRQVLRGSHQLARDREGLQALRLGRQ